MLAEGISVLGPKTLYCLLKALYFCRKQASGGTVCMCVTKDSFQLMDLLDFCTT